MNEQPDIRVFFIQGLPQCVAELKDGKLIEPLAMILLPTKEGDVLLQGFNTLCLFPAENPATLELRADYASYEAQPSLVADYLNRRREIEATRNGIMLARKPKLEVVSH